MSNPKGGEFFALDRGAFRAAAQGGMNCAVADLVLARGTARDNRTTKWSVHAIERHTGISRPRAAKAVEDLIRRGIWKKISGGKHPCYRSVPGDEIPGGAFAREEVEVLFDLPSGEKLDEPHQRAIAALKQK